ncbi:sterol desaturase family protein [Flavihumibacter sp. CACIAM 22H1]|uniref:sterol desaturase family protein n=1 Tax=Flavihumibacter sp. CACIAM 22H1 TaxID=1812911 RepID=UPI0007A90CB7|nr:sterol desaturase family protein [Flavihumibacter sp. CACIAM 22H1]KYP16303.1 MAG: fatty acid hydroxylase [Flavihumibacter sp. CACIAM 22H1]
MKDFLLAVWEQTRAFFGFDALIKIISEGDYSSLRTFEGIAALFAPIIPIILILELIRGLLYKKFSIISYKIPFFSYVLNAVLGRFIAIGMTLLVIGWLEDKALFTVPFTWYWFIYGYIVWELAHFVYHYLAHKVRLLWCFHSTHHAPETMHLGVTYSHFFLEAPYADLIRTTICILLGVPPPMLFVIMFIDGTWGAFIHVGETVMKKGDMGWFGKWILTPSHHRVHHAKNVAYMDTNFCNLLNIWDKVFKTYQPEKQGISIKYGITREMKPNNFMDAYFGEITALARDVYRAPGLKNKLLYLVMPPGWSHTGDHKTAAVMKKMQDQQDA